MSSGFLLLETQPGREGAVLDALARFHGVTHHNLIFPAAIAVRVESTTGVDALAAQLRALDGVTRTRLYRARHT
ncbi:MAG TPA: hypothetical protein VM370_05780 [Candidatus Thermoplasmatota archaeon]|nr:hypothetical protein [Candidatus Thermoplasmatota archaeon]